MCLNLRMSFNLTEYNREYAKLRRERNKKNRICTTCSKEKRKRGYLSCEDCLAKANKQKNGRA